MAIPRTRPGNYPAILSYGFRPFFLAGSLYAGIAILLWIPLFYGRIETDSLFAPVDWHVHEMLFGYLAAVMTGFLLTAIPNWTGRLPVQGLPLLVLVLAWLAGRIAVFFSGDIGWVAAMAIDCLFLTVVVIAAAIEIVSGRNWRNLKVLLPVGVLLLANATFHIEARLGGDTDFSRRLGLGTAIVLVMIIGGRIIPSFTRNWLVRENPGALPAPFGRFDVLAVSLSVLALLVWTIAAENNLTGGLLILAAILNTVRLLRWKGARAWRDPLVLVLHTAFSFVPIGFLLAGLSALLPDTVPPAAGIHALGVGAIGSMTLAVMTRATLGHTGRQLHANLAICAIYSLVFLAAVLRIAAACLPAYPSLLDASAACWTGAFLGYAAAYGAMLARPRVKPRASNA
jgi:uncharacterized protein involved in response to NO